MKNYYLAALFFAGFGLTHAQVFETGDMVFMHDVSNTGVASGASGDSHVMWTEANGTVNIGTMANGDQVPGMVSISSDGKYISGSMVNPATGLEQMSRYDIAAGTWKFLGALSASGTSSSWGMTSDGSVIVGLGQEEDYLGHAVKWSETTGLVDLGSTVSGSSSRANAVNDDGTVVVGWQDDDYGDRFGVYWKDGVQTHLTDNNGELVGEISAVTPDGKTMIGANYENPFIWNEADGFTELAHENPMFEGVATGVSDDGKTVIGFYREWGTGALTGSGFIWTKETGTVDLNAHVAALGLNDLGITFALPMGLSPDGKNIAGIGARDYDYVGFVIKLTDLLATEHVNQQNQVRIYPNPVEDVLYLSNATKITGIEIYNLSGQKVLSAQKITDQGLNVSKLAKGAYILKIKTGNETQSIKVLKK
ncbi:T9SS type A sorting domain-containing protein [Kaistella palustris]|uniref:T9SS type A sorting domain-containing protein n=1 Tax=Kaistella palustris TaxID=493376 RepID=UPI0004190662|nr:T9SS type A sorting domain-containing protein [Kaistella palustris]